MKDGTRTVWKYFRFAGRKVLRIQCRGMGEGTLEVFTGTESQGTVSVPVSQAWQTVEVPIEHEGVTALSLLYHGAGPADLAQIEFC